MASHGPIVFRLGAASNFIVSAPAIYDPRWATGVIGLDGLSDDGLFLLRIWAGMAFLWGLMFLEISRGLRARKPLIKYSWIEKTITAVSVTIAFLSAQVDPKVFYMVLVTDYLWIPLFLFYDVITRGGPRPGEALLEAARVLEEGGGPRERSAPAA